MSDISRTTTSSPTQQTQQQERSVSQEQPQQASQQRFEQKLKEKQEKKSSDKAKEKPRDLSDAMRQAKQGAQKSSSEALAARNKGDNPLARQSQNPDGTSAEHLLDKKDKTSAEKSDAILQGLQPQGAAGEHTIQGTQAVSKPESSSGRLFEEFQAVADRVMHTSQSLQQGGSVRLQLSNSVLPGTSVTFSMVAGALHVTFSGSNKKSLDKVREHKEGLVSHVREHSGVNIVVTTQNEQEDEQQGGTL